MSAIFGIYHRDGQPVSSDALVSMNNALALHGRDASGIWSNSNIGVGHRLFRTTPQDIFEQQPAISANDNCILVTDGRLDNRKELDSFLMLPISENRPDSDYILLAYEKWGADLHRHLIGPLAFALWDQKQQKLILARSPLSDRFIYYHITPKSLIFSSVPKAFPACGIPLKINADFLIDYLVLAPPDQGATFYDNIYTLPMGSAITVTSSKILHNQYWQPDLQFELRLKSDQEYTEAFTSLFERVVHDNLRCCKLPGAMMSGGLDSSSIAVTAASQLEMKKQSLITFTEVPSPSFSGIVPPGRYADESELVKLIGRKCNNINSTFIRTDGRFFLDDPFPIFEESGAPFYAAPNKVWYDAIHEQARQHDVRVLLTGAAGNMTISWDGRGLLSSLVRSGNLLQAWNETGSGTLFRRVRSIIGQGLAPFLPPMIWRSAKAFASCDMSLVIPPSPWRRYSSINPQVVTESVTSRWRSKNFDCSFNSNKESRYLRYEYFIKSDMTMIVSPGYRATYGVETRDPTRDIRIFEFCLSLPEEQYRRNGIGRQLIKRAMASRLPAEILNNSSRGLQAADWHERMCASSRVIENELALCSGSSLASEFIDIKRMKKIFSRHFSASHSIDAKTFDNCMILQKGLMSGCFLRWLESHCGQHDQK